MTDDKPRPDETQPVRPEGAALPPAPATPAADGTADQPAYAADPAPPSRRGFGERFRSLRRSDGSRAFGLAALIASALAGVIVGGLGLAAVHAVTDGDRDRDHGGWMQQRDADDRGPGPGRDGMYGGPRGVPGQLPPTTPPEDDDSSNS
jgi:hypothetical protein